MSPVVGVILMLALEISVAVGYIGLQDEWSGEPSYTFETVKAGCHCEPPTNPDGSVCEPVSTLDRIGVAWKCDLKPKLMYPEVVL